MLKDNINIYLYKMGLNMERVSMTAFCEHSNEILDLKKGKNKLSDYQHLKRILLHEVRWLVC
jgi:hypothetical protein